MSPTVIRFIVGGALGIAFSVSLMLPGTVVFPDDPPIRHLAAPDAPSTVVVQAAAPIAPPKKARAPRRVVVRPVHVPTIRTAPAASVVRHPPRRSKPAPRPVPRTSPPAQARLTPLSEHHAERTKAKKPEKAKKEKDDENGGHERDRGDDVKDKHKDKDKGKDKDKPKPKHKHKDTHKNDEGDHDEGGGERGGNSVGG